MTLADFRTHCQSPHGALRPRRGRWRWVVAAAAVPVLALLAASVYFVVSPPAAAPLALPRSAAARPVGPVSGTWSVAPGSLAGFRVRASAVGIGHDVVGRTGAVTGTVVVSGDWVTSAQLRIGLTAIRVDGRPQPQLALSLRSRQHPVATFHLTEVATLSRAFSSGAVITRRAAGFLSLNGTACPVTVTLSARRDGPDLQVAGSIPVDLAYWGIRDPAGAGVLGSLADHGEAEFRLILARR
ncbi:MAG TPA: YceI family protein [Streptosporangiaceae bacterium]